jgi:hypothetical protein
MFSRRNILKFLSFSLLVPINIFTQNEYHNCCVIQYDHFEYCVHTNYGCTWRRMLHLDDIKLALNGMNPYPLWYQVKKATIMSSGILEVELYIGRNSGEFTVLNIKDWKVTELDKTGKSVRILTKEDYLI